MGEIDDIEHPDTVANRKGHPRAQYLYVMGSRREGPLKIGVASKPKARRIGLQSGSPDKLLIFWCYPCPCGLTIEPLIHRMLANFRLEGEWFDIPVEIAMAVLWIAAQGTGDDYDQDLIDEWCRHLGLCLKCERAHTFDPEEWRYDRRAKQKETP